MHLEDISGFIKILDLEQTLDGLYNQINEIVNKYVQDHMEEFPGVIPETFVSAEITNVVKEDDKIYVRLLVNQQHGSRSYFLGIG